MKYIMQFIKFLIYEYVQPSDPISITFSSDFIARSLLLYISSFCLGIVHTVIQSNLCLAFTRSNFTPINLLLAYLLSIYTA